MVVLQVLIMKLVIYLNQHSLSTIIANFPGEVKRLVLTKFLTFVKFSIFYQNGYISFDKVFGEINSIPISRSRLLFNSQNKAYLFLSYGMLSSTSAAK